MAVEIVDGPPELDWCYALQRDREVFFTIKFGELGETHPIKAELWGQEKVARNGYHNFTYIIKGVFQGMEGESEPIFGRYHWAIFQGTYHTRARKGVVYVRKGGGVHPEYEFPQVNQG